MYGPEPDDPAPYFDWGDLPDQHGRQWGSDDGPTTPGTTAGPTDLGLPTLMPWWGNGQPPTGPLPGTLPRLRAWTPRPTRPCEERSSAATGRRSWTCSSTASLRKRAQLAGDGLLLAAEQHVAGATSLVRELAEDLPGQFDPGVVDIFATSGNNRSSSQGDPWGGLASR